MGKSIHILHKAIHIHVYAKEILAYEGNQQITIETMNFIFKTQL